MDDISAIYGIGRRAGETALPYRRGVRVAGMNRESDGTWTLLGVDGAAAYHDTAEVTSKGGGALGRYGAPGP